MDIQPAGRPQRDPLGLELDGAQWERAVMQSSYVAVQRTVRRLEPRRVMAVSCPS